LNAKATLLGLGAERHLPLGLKRRLAREVVADLVMRGFASRDVAPRIAEAVTESALFQGLDDEQVVGRVGDHPDRRTGRDLGAVADRAALDRAALHGRLGPDAAAALVAAGVRLVGIDAAFSGEHKHLFNDFGINLRKNEMYDQAVEYYARALELSPNDENLHYNIAKAHSFAGNDIKALEHLHSALSIRGDFPEARAMAAKLSGGIAQAMDAGQSEHTSGSNLLID